MIVAIGIVTLTASPSIQAADFSWNQTTTGQTWSLLTNWNPASAAGGPSAAGTFVLINTNITAANTISLFNTLDLGTATKTVGRLDIGDTNNTHQFTIAAGTGSGILNFNGSGSNAQLNELSTSNGDTISAPITLTTSLDITNASANTLTLSTGGITAATAGTKTITTSTGAVTISGNVGDGSGTIAIAQNGPGTLTLAGNNSYSGATIVSGGTLNAAGSGSNRALGATSGVTVNSGGTLLMGANNQFSAATPAAVTVAGGTLNAGGSNQGTSVTIGVGALTLSSSSVIDLAGTSLLHFAASNGQTWSGTLSIYNWSGTPVTGGGAEQLLFGTNTSALTAGQLSEFQFYSDAGLTPFTAGGVILSTGEVVPVPEPTTWLAGGLAFSGLLFTQRRRFARSLKRAA